MTLLIVLFFGLLFWSNRSRIKTLRKDVDILEGHVRGILISLEKQRVKPPSEMLTSDKSPVPQADDKPPVYEPVSPVASEIKAQTSQPQDELILASKANTPPRTLEIEEEAPISFEQQWGARLPVWIGGVALALAGFFMVKYSIETGLLSPTVRVVLGIVFGLGLLSSAHWIRGKEGFANGTRISQALSGAGIADLYVCVFAASNLYHLIPDSIAFLGMAAVTALAVLWSLKYGMPIALLGLVGGLLTPALVGSASPQAPILFIYLYFVVTGLLIAIRKQHWWTIAIPTVLGAFLWVCAWLYAPYCMPSDSIYLGLFLIAVSATVVATSKKHYEQESPELNDPIKVSSILNYLTLGGAVVLTGIVAERGGFGVMQWGLFGLLSLGGLSLAFFNQKLYGLVPWVSMGVAAVMFLNWHPAEPNAFALTLSLFATLYICGGYLMQSRSEGPLLGAGLAAAASLSFYLIGYYQLHDADIVTSIPLFWGLVALIFFGLATLALYRVVKKIAADHPQRQALMGIYAGTATAFLSIAFEVELSREFLSVALAAELFALTYINTRVDVKAIRSIVAMLVCVFAYSLIPQIIVLMQLIMYGLIGVHINLSTKPTIVNWPAFQLGLPGLFFAAGSYFLRLSKDGRLVRALELGAIALIGLTGYYLTRQAFHIDENIFFVKMGFIERGAVSTVLFVYGLACLWIGRRYLRRAVTFGGLALCAGATFRILYFDFIVYNPLWSSQNVGKLPLINNLLVNYGLPILWAWRATVELAHAGKEQWNKWGYAFAVLLAFTLLSLNVRQFFHGAYLTLGSATSNPEIYTYSVIWLLFGLALLLFGTLKKNKRMRVASLAIMILTVGKVFLYDASELEGLFRVFSFFGLGLSLLGLSWFYTRFVFGKDDLRRPPAARDQSLDP